jgi:glycosyltransferase involved in cell wall biosynthesis
VLRARSELRQALSLRLWSTFPLLLVPAAGALLGGASGAAWGLALGALIAGIGSLIVVSKPTPAHDGTPRLLIDASNLRVGGGVQVAASFLDELAALQEKGEVEQYRWLKTADVHASPVVARELGPGTSSRLSVEVRRLSWRKWLFRSRQRFDVVFVVFGPDYGRRRSRRLVMGFADGTLVHDRPGALPAPRGRARVRQTVRRIVAAWAFRRSDVLVVETDELRRVVSQRLPFDLRSIEVVPNSWSRVFDELESWLPLDRDVRAFAGNATVLSYVCRNYPHKNLEFLGGLGAELRRIHHCDVVFAVTLTETEWRRMSAGFRAACINVGPLDVRKVPTLLQSTDGVIFPSLLESFSATPIEAMRMGKPLFASDRSFVRTVCKDAPIFFDPEDPVAAAKVVAGALADPRLLVRHVKLGLEIARSAPTARDRALRYLKILDRELEIRESRDAGAAAGDGARTEYPAAQPAP